MTCGNSRGCFGICGGYSLRGFGDCSDVSVVLLIIVHNYSVYVAVFLVSLVFSFFLGA